MEFKGQIKVKHVYICNKCKTTQPGECHSIEVTSIKDIEKHSSNLRACNMPVGWASSYNVKGTLYLCPKCK